MADYLDWDLSYLDEVSYLLHLWKLATEASPCGISQVKLGRWK
jgi:hypothetical protein